MEAKIQRKGTAIVVSIVEEFRGTHGTMYMRAISKNGHRLVAPSRIFTVIPGGKANIDPADLQPDLTKGISKLKNIFAVR